MIDLTVELVSHDDTRRDVVSLQFAHDEWDTLQQFHEDTERLRSTRFVQNKRGGEIGISWQRGRGVRPSAAAVDEEEVWAMLMKLRPFVLQREPHYFHRIKKMLNRRLTHTAFRKHLDVLADSFTLRAMGRRLSFRGPGRPPLSSDVVMDWLNAFEYHKDKVKRSTVQADLGVFGHDQNGLPVILFALVDMIMAVLHLGDLVEALLQVERDNLSVIRCSLEYFEEA